MSDSNFHLNRNSYKLINTKLAHHHQLPRHTYRQSTNNNNKQHIVIWNWCRSKIDRSWDRQPVYEWTFVPCQPCSFVRIHKFQPNFVPSTLIFPQIKKFKHDKYDDEYKKLGNCLQIRLVWTQQQHNPLKRFNLMFQVFPDNPR